MEKLIRKYQNNLIISGYGVIMFGVWNIARFFLMYYFAQDLLAQLFLDFGLELDNPNIDNLILRKSILIITFVVLSIDSLIKFYIGKTAVSVGRGKKGKKAYFVLAVFLLIVMVPSDLSGLIFISGALEKTDTIATTIVDLSCCYALFDLSRAAIKLRKLEKEKKNAG